MRHILITGASSGIGLALTELLSKNNHVICMVRNPQKMKAEIQRLSIPESSITIIKADVSDSRQVQKALKKLKALDIVINNAGYGLYGAFEELDFNEFRKQIETNFFGCLYVIKHSLPLLYESQDARILNVTSILGQVVLPTGSAYCSSKWALEAFTESLRYELAPFQIQVCAIEPGLIRTGFKSAMQTTALESKSRFGFLNQLIKDEMQSYGKMSTSAEKAAKKIAKLVQKRKIPARFRVGIDAKFAYLAKNLIPAGIIDSGYRYFTRRLYEKSVS